VIGRADEGLAPHALDDRQVGRVNPWSATASAIAAARTPHAGGPRASVRARARGAAPPAPCRRPVPTRTSVACGRGWRWLGRYVDRYSAIASSAPARR
jgi:hypothetical protein